MLPQSAPIPVRPSEVEFGHAVILESGMRFAIELVITNFPQSQPYTNKFGGALDNDLLAPPEGLSFWNSEPLGQNHPSVPGRCLDCCGLRRFGVHGVCRFKAHVAQGTAWAPHLTAVPSPYTASSPEKPLAWPTASLPASPSPPAPPTRPKPTLTSATTRRAPPNK